MSEGFDVGLEMSGNAQAFNSMLDSLNHGGKIALLGIFPEEVAIDWSSVVFKGPRLKGYTDARCTRPVHKWPMLQSGLKPDPIITHRLSAEGSFRPDSIS